MDAEGWYLFPSPFLVSVVAVVLGGVFVVVENGRIEVVDIGS